MSAVVRFPGGYDDAAPPPPPPDEPEDLGGGCPVGFLGQHKSTFYFFNHHGQVIDLTARQISQGAEISALFGSHGVTWLADEFPAHDKEGKVIVGKFSVTAVHHWIQRQSDRAGLFDPATPSRGLGMWLAGRTPVLHLGHSLLWGDTWRKPGFREAGAIWQAFHGVAEVAAPATPTDVRKLETLLRRWHWREPMGAEMMLGLWAAGMMGAAIPWRPHGFLLAEAGAGKSTLAKVLAAANPISKLVDDYTEAGLRQDLSTHASALLLDEADPDDATAAEKLQRVISLLRRASSGAGAVVLRGSPGGEGKTFTVVGCAIMIGTLPPSLNAADASRITLLGLLKLGKDAVEPSEGEIAEIARLASAFLARAVSVLDRFPAAFSSIRRQILEMDGGTHRIADQIGTILAARHIMLDDGDVPALGDELADMTWAIPTAADQEADGAPQRCWSHLLDSGLESYRSGERPTVRRVLADALGPPEIQPHRAQSDLFEHGMRVGHYPLSARDGPMCLYVRNNHPRLETIFTGTRWAGGKWSEELSRLPDAQRPPHPVSLRRGEKHRCVVIPPSLLPGRWDVWDTD